MKYLPPLSAILLLIVSTVSLYAICGENERRDDPQDRDPRHPQGGGGPADHSRRDNNCCEYSNRLYPSAPSQALVEGTDTAQALDASLQQDSPVSTISMPVWRNGKYINENFEVTESALQRVQDEIERDKNMLQSLSSYQGERGLLQRIIENQEKCSRIYCSLADQGQLRSTSNESALKARKLYGQAIEQFEQLRQAEIEEKQRELIVNVFCCMGDGRSTREGLRQEASIKAATYYFDAASEAAKPKNVRQRFIECHKLAGGLQVEKLQELKQLPSDDNAIRLRQLNRAEAEYQNAIQELQKRSPAEEKINEHLEKGRQHRRVTNTTLSGPVYIASGLEAVGLLAFGGFLFFASLPEDQQNALLEEFRTCGKEIAAIVRTLVMMHDSYDKRSAKRQSSLQPHSATY